MRVTHQVARKAHSCDLCSGRIERGEAYARWYCGSAHEDCAELAGAYDAWGPVTLRRELRAMGDDLAPLHREVVERRGLLRTRKRRATGPLFDARRCTSVDRTLGEPVQCVLHAGHPADGSDAFAYHLGPEEGPLRRRRVWADGQVTREARL